MRVVLKPTYVLAKNMSHAMPQCYSVHISLSFDLMNFLNIILFKFCAYT